MPEGEALLQRLLEELLETGRSVEAVCADHPELIPEVRRRLGLVQDVQAHMDALFPAPNPEEGNGSAHEAPKPE